MPRIPSVPKSSLAILKELVSPKGVREESEPNNRNTLIGLFGRLRG
jgi:hypothetical protein